MTLKPRKIIIEHYGTYSWLALFPSGRVEEFRNKSDAEKAARHYFARAIRAAGETRVDFIEWRDETDKGAAMRGVR